MRLITPFIAVMLAMPAFAQPKAARPIPYPVLLPRSFEAAIQAGTRTDRGVPGHNYWINEARYELEAVLSPATRRLRGSGRIHYTNNSPDTLDRLYVHLRQNIYRAGSIRNTPLPLTGGMHLSRALLDGEPLIESPRGVGYSIENTLMEIRPPSPLLPGDSVELEFSWEYEVRDSGHLPREGTDGEVFFIGYWYPQMAVYDDVIGWDVDPFRDWAEFYMDHADYDVRITAPAGWLVAATGELQNAEVVLAPFVRERLAQAAGSSDVIAIVAADERGSATAGSASGSLTWHFRANRVRDFAFGASDKYVWDATSANTGAGRSLIHAFYRPDAPSWERAAEFGRFAVEFLSDLIMPYPYSHMTSMEGIVAGGMEYPMITILGGDRSPRSLFDVTVHEISHVWFPMIVSSPETDFTWMDEGLTTFNVREAVREFWPDEDPWAPNTDYFRLAGSGDEIEVMRHGDQYSSVRTLVAASYDKTSRILHALRGIVGEEPFLQAYRTYAERWAYKHPYPYDFFNTFEEVLEQDLDWFWQPLFFETWTTDQGIKEVDVRASRVTIEDVGLAPMPVLVRVTLADGRTEDLRVPVDAWLRGEREVEVDLPPGPIIRIEIDPDGYLPDVHRDNNVWSRD